MLQCAAHMFQCVSCPPSARESQLFWLRALLADSISLVLLRPEEGEESKATDRSTEPATAADVSEGGLLRIPEVPHSLLRNRAQVQEQSLCHKDLEHDKSCINHKVTIKIDDEQISN